jgi:hypothetical protein
MKTVRGSYKKSKVDGAYAFSKWVRYRNGRWIPTRKRVFLYWFKFLVEAEKSDEYQVDWSKYKGWGGSRVILSTKFDDWWEERWEDLFSTESRDDEPRYNISTKSPKADAYKLRLRVWNLRDKPTPVIAIKTGLDWGQGFQAYGDINRITNRHKKKAKEHLSNVSSGTFP